MIAHLSVKKDFSPNSGIPGHHRPSTSLLGSLKAPCQQRPIMVRQGEG